LKKYIAIIATMLFVVGFAASAFAIHAEIPAETSAMVVRGESTVTLDGEIRFRGEIKETDFDADTGTTSAYDGRIRLSLEAKVAPNATGFVQLETSTGDDTHDTYTWGSDFSASSAGIYKQGNTKRGDLRLLQGWINWKPTDVVGLKIGHMPLALGNKIFFNHTKFGDDAIVVYADPNKKLHVAALTIKLYEGDAAVYDDTDAYVALAVADLGKAKVSGDITYLTDESPKTAGLAAPLGIPAGILERVTLYNVGARADINAGPVVIWVDGNYQSGTAEDNDDEGTLTDDIDIAAHSIVAGVKMKAGPVNVAVDGGYGTGQDLDEDEDLNLFLTALGAHGNAPLYTYVYDYRVPGASGATQAGISNTTYVAGRVSGKAAKNISWNAQLVWLKATEKVVDGEGDETDEIGTEVDGKITFQLAKGLKYWIEGGYLAAGEVYEDANGDVDPAYAVRNGIALDF
jgi:hypothetical protein